MEEKRTNIQIALVRFNEAMAWSWMIFSTWLKILSVTGLDHNLLVYFLLDGLLKCFRGLTNWCNGPDPHPATKRKTTPNSSCP